MNKQSKYIYVWGYMEELDPYLWGGTSRVGGETITLYFIFSVIFIFMGCLLIFFNIDSSVGKIPTKFQ